MKIDATLPPFYSQAGHSFLFDYMLEHRNFESQYYSDQDATNFLIYCFSNHQHSRSQLFQDIYVLFRTGAKTEGYFIEFGATDGMFLSNTFLLEKYLGWNGILAEPNPSYLSRLKANRSCFLDNRCVWSKSGEQIDFLVVHDNPQISTITAYRDNDLHGRLRLSEQAEQISIETISLNDLLYLHQAPKDFDYLSIDTEGSELEILSALDFDRFRPHIMTIEHNYNEVQRRGIYQLLTGLGYRREFEDFSKWDDWYVLNR